LFIYENRGVATRILRESTKTKVVAKWIA